MNNSMEMSHSERQDLIDDLLDDYKARAQQFADETFEAMAHHSERDRQALYAGHMQGRVRMLLEDIAIWSPRLFAELIAREKQRDAA